MTDEEREVMSSLLEYAEDNVWHFEDNPTDRSVCYSCNAKIPVRQELKHQEGCKLLALLDRARALVAQPSLTP